MKKMLTTKAIHYAKQILNLERVINDENSSEERIKEAQFAIEKILDEVADTYEPTAIYKIDEQVEILERKMRAVDKK